MWTLFTQIILPKKITALAQKYKKKLNNTYQGIKLITFDFILQIGNG